MADQTTISAPVSDTFRQRLSAVGGDGCADGMRGEPYDDDVEDYYDPPPALPALPTLEGDQLEAFAAICVFLAGSEQCFCLQGLAGTGKTTVLATLARELEHVTMVAPTGKAASVLSRKTGSSAMTLHRLLYNPVETEGGVVFNKNYEPGEYADRIALVDEASMVGVDLATDLLESGIRVVSSGDPGQLPPVNEVPFFTRADFTLQQIHRQAQGSPIIRQAHRVREGLDYARDGEAFQIIDSRQAVAAIEWADVILCWRNEVRHRMNRYIRGRRGIAYDALPQVGEPLMCLQNSGSIMNGEMFTVAEYDHLRGLTLDNGLKIPTPWFEWRPGKKRAGWSRDRTPFALGYATTVHKAQGSEWPRVLVLDEFYGRDRARWLYTAITRASEAVAIVRRQRT